MNWLQDQIILQYQNVYSIIFRKNSVHSLDKIFFKIIVKNMYEQHNSPNLLI